MNTRLTNGLGVVDVVHFLFRDDGSIPNHPTWPMIVYRGVLRLDASDPASTAEQLFTRNGWQGTWRNGIFDFPHYHSNAHEVLAICRGRATVRFGGKEGETLTVEAGDVALLPAGTGHQRLSPSGGLLVVGAYPPGQVPDLCRGTAGERPDVLVAIQQVTLPETDPVCGSTGPLLQYWK